MLTEQHRLILLMHDFVRRPQGKMGFALLRYRNERVTAVVDETCAGQSLRDLTGLETEVPVVATIEEALVLGGNTVVLGVATRGGVIPDRFRADMVVALDHGASLVNPLHARLNDDPSLSAALHCGAFIWDVRQEPPGLATGTGAASLLSCRRVLTIGTDMAVGKMTASFELDAAARRRGLRSHFLASGQIGIVLAGDGVALDAVRVDFASGAIEQLVMRYGADADIVWVEGQGSIVHPASTAWLPLMRGSAPTHLVLVHRPGQVGLERFPDIRIPPLVEVIAAYEAVAAIAGGPPCKVAAIALNGGRMADDELSAWSARISDETGLPAVDVVRFGADPLLDVLL